MTGKPGGWVWLRRLRNRLAWSGLSPKPAREGGGGPAGPHARGRAILQTEHCDRKWAEACLAWDRARIDIRAIDDDEDQAEAWHLATDAMRQLHADIRHQFANHRNEEEG